MECFSLLFSPTDRKCNDRPINPVTLVSRVTRCGSSLLRTSTSGQTSVKGAAEAPRLPHHVVASCADRCTEMDAQ